MSEKKIRVLALCDSPTVATGFAQVSRNILNRLSKGGKYDIDVIGINFEGQYYDRDKFPYKIFPANPSGGGDMYGRALLLDALSGNQMQNGLVPPWDLIWILQDHFIVEGVGINFPFGEQLFVTKELWKRSLDPALWFSWIGYWPVDSDLKENWVTKAIMLPDFPIAYCEYGANEIKKFDKKDYKMTFNLNMDQNNPKDTTPAKIKVAPLADRMQIIHHGVDLDIFHPIDEKEKKAFRKEFFDGKVADDTFLVMNISRNQPRKDIMRTLQVFSEFIKKVPNSYLYLHMASRDIGGSIDEMARNFGLSRGIHYSLPANFEAGNGYPVDTINKLYNIADACITTTMGEGWGFITTEAMATKTPVVAPNHTSILDIFGSYVPEGQDLNEYLENGGWDKVRGVPVKAGSTKSEWFSLGLQDNERLRPLTNVDDMVEKLIWVYSHKAKVKEMTERAFNWVQDLSWDKIVKQWDDVFQTAYKRLEEQREIGRNIDKAGRNDPCPCGSGLKFKKCHGSQQKIDKFKDWLN